MATGSILLSVMAAVPADGTASNAAPQPITVAGTETSPHKSFKTYNFDAATNEHLWYTFTMPQNYASGGVVRVTWKANATTGAAVWGARIGAHTPGTDNVITHAAAAATTVTTTTDATAQETNQSVITLANLDSAAAGDLIFLLVYRDAANGSDSLSVDAELMDSVFEYTTT